MNRTSSGSRHEVRQKALFGSSPVRCAPLRLRGGNYSDRSRANGVESLLVNRSVMPPMYEATQKAAT